MSDQFLTADVPPKPLSLQLFLDAGMNSDKKANAILITHSHSDHSFQVPTLGMGHGKQSVDVVVPAAMEAPLRHLARASQSLNDCVAPIDREVCLY